MAYRFSAERIQRRLVAAASISVSEVVFEYQTRIKRTLSIPGTGRLYRKSKGYGKRRNLRERGYHRASAPGQPPAVDTGTLRRSWQAGSDLVLDRSQIRNRNAPRIRVGSRVRYARWLQYGTSRMAARPYVNVAANDLRRSGVIGRIVQRNVARALRLPR